MRSIAILALLGFAACSPPRSYTRPTTYPLMGVFACSIQQMKEMGYDVVLSDSVGGLLQGRREITGLRETARRGAAAATELITAGLAGGKRTRYDELTVFVYTRLYPQGNTLESAAGMLTVGADNISRGRPSDDARADAYALAERCSTRD